MEKEKQEKLEKSGYEVFATAEKFVESLPKEEMITNAAAARRNIGQKVYWDELDSRSVYLKSGILEEVVGYNVRISGDWKYRTRLSNFRNYENGGAWKRAGE